MNEIILVIGVVVFLGIIGLLLMGETPIVTDVSNFITFADVNANFVPYIGASSDVNLNDKNFSAFNVYANELNLTNSVYTDLLVPITQVRLGILNPPSFCAIKGNTYGLCFGDVPLPNEQDVFFTAQMSHAYKLGSTIKFHLHTFPVNNTNCNIVWCYEWSYADMDTVFSNSQTVCKVQSTGLNNAFKHTIFEINDVNSFSMLSGIINARLYRNSSSGLDTCAGINAGLVSLDYHYELDSLGSEAIIQNKAYNCFV